MGAAATVAMAAVAMATVVREPHRTPVNLPKPPRRLGSLLQSSRGQAAQGQPCTSRPLLAKRDVQSDASTADATGGAAGVASAVAAFAAGAGVALGTWTSGGGAFSTAGLGRRNQLSLLLRVEQVGRLPCAHRRVARRRACVPHVCARAAPKRVARPAPAAHASPRTAAVLLILSCRR